MVGILTETCDSPRTRRPTGVRLIVSGISRDTSWQVRILFIHFIGPLARLLYPLAYMDHRHKDKAGRPLILNYDLVFPGHAGFPDFLPP